VRSASAAEVDPAVTRIRGFYDVLLDTMKQAHAMPVRARYEKLEPAVRATFDLPAMTRIAVGPAWTTIDTDDQKALLEQFGRLTIATYANRFDGYSGEHFEVEPTAEERGANRIVHSTLVRPKGEPIALNYLVHPVDDGWKATDVYLKGTISELATRRSEFGALLRSGGPAALIDSLRQRADKLLAS
jgi:phospholipid transport system substrate-binding protein